MTSCVKDSLSLTRKFVYMRGEGVKKIQIFRLRKLWTTPKAKRHGHKNLKQERKEAAIYLYATCMPRSLVKQTF